MSKKISVAEKQIAEVQNLENAIISCSDILMETGEVRGIIKSVTVAEILMIEKFIKLTKSKQYIGIPFKNQNGDIQNVRTVAEFCEVFFKNHTELCVKKRSVLTK